MKSGQFPRGSEWRRWDLQVHTPFSALNNGFGTDFDEYARQLFTAAIDRQIAAIGVTDYFSIEGYAKLKALIADRPRLIRLLGDDEAEAATRILLLPNIELRSNLVVSTSRGSARVNYHVIFSDRLEPETIAQHFLLGLKFTSESSPGARDDQLPVTNESFEQLGRTLKQQHARFQGMTDRHVGMMNAVIPHEMVTELLQAPRFQDSYLVAVPADEDLSQLSWDGQAHLSRKLLLQKAHLFFSSNSNTREFGLGRKHPTPDLFIDEFKSLKPCVHGSDAHDFASLFRPDSNRFLWIKADPTFAGLRQLLNEPESRVHIGERPPTLTRVEQNPTKYIKSVRLERTDSAPETEKWFSGEYELNAGLVAIIGRKGSGKTAFAEAIALACNSRSAEHFSFIRKDRFLSPRSKLGPGFAVHVTWGSGRVDSKRFDDSIDIASLELVKHIPQSYLETICSELRGSSDTRFYTELMEVIYSHVDQANRLGRNSLPELIEYITSEKEQEIQILLGSLHETNSQIIEAERQATPEHRRALETELVQRREELAAHDSIKPREVKEPALDPSTQETMVTARRELAAFIEQAESLDVEIATAQASLKELTLRVATVAKVLDRIENLRRTVDKFYTDVEQDARVIGAVPRELVALTTNLDRVHSVREAAEKSIKDLRESLDPERPTSLVARRASVSASLESTRAKLSAPDRAYQEHLHSLATWAKRRDEINGSADEPNSVLGLANRVAGLDILPTQICELNAARMQIVSKVVHAKLQLLAEYRLLYSPVQRFIDEHPVSKQHGGLQFTATITQEGFADQFLGMIHQGRRGSFQGEDGRERVKEALASATFGDVDGVSQFLNAMQSLIVSCQRDGVAIPVQLKDQLRQGIGELAVLDYVYGLSYLAPRFELRWSGKTLDQLSPGERGNLLLVFYLLIDQRTVPLLIDQPEENLDNQSIATTLVPAVKYAKERRQIILVTHNPNLAVVCDAEQVVHASIDKPGGNAVSYVSGSLEDANTSQFVVDVLEGTRPAFDLRDAKYGVTSLSRLVLS
jgi:ABC-type lipoprotein export system ATPase subunit